MYHRNGNLYNLSRSQHRVAKHSSKSKNVSPTSTFSLILFNTFSPSRESLLTKEETRVPWEKPSSCVEIEWSPSHLHQQRWANKGQVAHSANGAHQFCRTESCFWSNWVCSLRMSGSVMRSSLNSAGLTSYICGQADTVINPPLKKLNSRVQRSN